MNILAISVKLIVFENILFDFFVDLLTNRIEDRFQFFSNEVKYRLNCFVLVLSDASLILL